MQILVFDKYRKRVYDIGMITSKIPLQLKIKGWRPYEIAKRTGVSPNTAQRLARGDTNFSIATLGKLCQLFQVRDVNEVIEYTPDK